MKQIQSLPPLHNRLPADGIVHYYGKILPEADADIFFDLLMRTIEWRPDEAMMFGRKIITKRKVAWYGDRPYEYTYSKISKQALPWNDVLLELKSRVETIGGKNNPSSFQQHFYP